MKIKKRQYKKPRKINRHVIREKQSQYLFPDFHSNLETATGLMNGKKQGDIIDLGERGIYANNNKLNDLTGKEWKFATKSVITKVFPLNLQHKLRKEHGGQKPPELCSDLIKTFTKEKMIVLDPLAGVGGTLLGASLCNRKAMGIELNPKWVKIYKQVCAIENIKHQEVIIGDCKIELKKFTDNYFDFILTDVPYWHMDQLEKTRSKKTKQSNLSQFNNSPTKTKDEWLKEMQDIFRECQRVLKNNKYLAIFIGDMYRKNEYHILSAELANTIKNPHLTLKANLIWYDVSKSLHVYGYPAAFIPSMIHQNILIFRKEEQK